MQMYKVFINDHLIRLLSEAPIKETRQGLLTVYDASQNEVQILVESLFNETEKLEIDLIYHDLESAWAEFQASFKIVKAAGGVIWNENGEKLLIYRLNKWDLPKGKMEKGESPKESAIREVEEECDLKDLEIQEELRSTYHMYQMGTATILKVTHWFSMLAKGNLDVKPQTEEGITKVEWVSESELSKVRANTYRSLLELI